MRSFRFVVLAAMLVSSVALAQPEKNRGASPHGHPASGKHEKDDKDGKEKGNRAEAASAKPGDDDDDDDAVSDGGKPMAGRRTPAQLAFRRGLWERREKTIEAAVHKGGKPLTIEEREVIRQHWLRVARLVRIRELAQEAHDDAIVKRVDAALEREEKRSETKLEKLNAKAGGEK